jgi:chromosome segregation ATPase
MRIKKTVESLVAAVSSTDVAAIERALTKLEARRTQLAESLDAATHNAVDASAARRESIIANRDQQTLEEAYARVREAEEQRVALDDALRTLDQKIAETTTRFEDAKDKAERERVGQLLEQEVDKIEEASQALDKTAKRALPCRPPVACAVKTRGSERTKLPA